MGALLDRRELRARAKARLPFLIPVVGLVRDTRRRVEWHFDDLPDRHVLEHAVFPAVAAYPGTKPILFVGVEFYTAGYPRKHFPTHEFWTIDVREEVARYGARGHHIVDSVVDLSAHFPPAGLDAIVCNGVFGWGGLDSRQDCETAFGQFFECLRPGGLLVHGWNDSPEHRPFPPETIESLSRFEPYALPPFPYPRYPTFSPLKHVFDFYRRPSST